MPGLGASLNEEEIILVDRVVVDRVLVYIPQPALYALYLLYAGCRYPGAAADRPPRSPVQQASW